ncbi:MAG: MbcA/ParS/Xre antitoxin family protein [Stellaceae bacterium]
MGSPTTAIQSSPDEGIPLERRRDRGVRGRLSAPGLRTFFNIAAEWGLSGERQRVLLGGIAPSTYHKWKSGAIGTLSYDQLERISLVLGIYKALRMLFADDASGVRWLKAANTERLFAGGSPLDRMLRGSIDDLYAARRYLDGWRGVWP